MTGTPTFIDAQGARRAGRGSMVMMGFALLIAVAFLIGFAFPYLTLNQQRFGPFWPRRGWLLLHIVPGMVALLVAPVQLWLGVSRRMIPVHRRLGYVYMGSISVSVVAAYYLAFHSDGPGVFAAGLFGLATVWVITTGLAFIAIRRRQFQQHREWMIRSSVVTFGFVFFRMLAGVLQAMGVGTIEQDLSAAAWFCWAAPLFVTEVFLQGRKMFAVQGRAGAWCLRAFRTRWPC